MVGWECARHTDNFIRMEEASKDLDAERPFLLESFLVGSVGAGVL